MQGREAKRNLPWSIQEDSNCQQREIYHEVFKRIATFSPFWSTSWSSNYAYYVVSKLGKSAIQRYKRCMIRSWNKGVTTIGSRSHQAEGQFHGLRIQPLAAKSQEDGREISLWLRNGVLHAAKFCSHLARLRNSPEASRYLRPTFFRFFASDIWCLNPQTLLVIHLS